MILNRLSKHRGAFGVNACGRYNLRMLRKLASRPDWQIAMAITAALRVFYTAMAAAFSPFLHPDPALIRSNALTENLPAPHGLHYALLGIWERFDTLWFLRIAEHGYDRPMAVIFYPLYPAAIRLVSGLMPAAVAALLVSTVAAFFFFWGLLRLADSSLTATGRLRMLLLVAVWPASFALFAGYAESLTLALIVWAVVFATSRPMVAGSPVRVSGGIRPTFGRAGCSSPRVLALRSRRAAVAGGGSYASGIAGLLGLATLVGTSVCCGSLPAAIKAWRWFRRGGVWEAFGCSWPSTMRCWRSSWA